MITFTLVLSDYTEILFRRALLYVLLRHTSVFCDFRRFHETTYAKTVYFNLLLDASLQSIEFSY